LTAVAACLLALPAGARAGSLPLEQSPAAGTYTEGEPAITSGFSCASVASGFPVLGPDTLVAAAIQGAAPRVGDVFYLRLTGVELGDPCTGGTSVLPELLPLKGVGTAIDAAHPVLLRYEAFDNGNVADDAVVVKAGQTGGTEFDAISTRAPQGEPFPIATGNGKLELYVPLRATRRTAAADTLTVANMIGNASTPAMIQATVGLPSSAPAKPVLKVGAKLALTVTTVPGAKVTATLTSGRKTVGTAKGTVAASGTVTLKPKAKRGYKRAKLTLKTVLGDGSRAPDVTKTVSLR
jgi:hypothetical protein